MTEETPPRRDWRVALLLTLLPLWLVVSSGVGIWLYLRHQKKEAEAEIALFATPVDGSDLADDVAKLIGFAGERHPGSAAGVQGLNRAAAMIEGALGPGNAGYRVERHRGPATPSGNWPLLIATIRGKDAKLPPLWVVAPYDSRAGSPGAEANATGTASVLAAARAMAGFESGRPVHFAFLPHGCDPESPVIETLEMFGKRAQGAYAVLVVEAMGGGGSLVLSSREAENPVFSRIGGLGEAVGAEAICLEDDFDLSSMLFETGLPAVRVSTRGLVKESEPDVSAPDAGRHETATKALVELIRRLDRAL